MAVNFRVLKGLKLRSADGPVTFNPVKGVKGASSAFRGQKHRGVVAGVCVLGLD